MKWWGWGSPEVAFPMHERPKLWPWIEKNLGLRADSKTQLPALKDFSLNPSSMKEAFLSELNKILQPSQLSDSLEDRVVHSYGKSYADLLRIRKGIIARAPDLVVYPQSQEQVLAVVKLARDHQVRIIPFGGGTNIVGAVEVKVSEGPTLSLDMKRMNRVLHLDKVSGLAVIEAGILGPKLEQDLNREGFSLGHFPDSFEFSTLGGWIATRSAGMQSDAYGKIEQLVSGLSVVGKDGLLQFKSFPASSAGPDLKQLFIGSEGALGVITQAVMRVHPLPETKKIIGFLFPDFHKGVEAIKECYRQGVTPSMVRLQDENETDLALHFKGETPRWKEVLQFPVKAYLKEKGYQRPAVMVLGVEGKREEVKFRLDHLSAIMKRYQGFPLGKSVGDSWSKDKYNMPYLRDYIMDHQCMADVGETSANWSQLLPLYQATVREMQQFFRDKKQQGYIGCHLSHSYQDGACLYFTFAVKQEAGNELGQYYEYKKKITETFVKHGGTLSHHHAVGLEHLPWLRQEWGDNASEAFREIKQVLDPQNLFNPGALDTEREHAYMKLEK